MLSNQQNLFLEHLLQLGDRDLTLKRVGLTTRDFILWMQNTDFKNEVERIEKYFMDNLIVKISQVGLKKLDYVLNHGITTKTNTTQTTYHPEFGNITTVKNSVKVEEISLPSIREAIKIYILMKVERDVLSNISALASRGLLPQNSESLIAATMAEYQSKVQDAMKGDYEKVGINDEMLAQIQQLVINGS